MKKGQERAYLTCPNYITLSNNSSTEPYPQPINFELVKTLDILCRPAILSPGALSFASSLAVTLPSGTSARVPEHQKEVWAPFFETNVDLPGGSKLSRLVCEHQLRSSRGTPDRRPDATYCLRIHPAIGRGQHEHGSSSTRPDTQLIACRAIYFIFSVSSRVL